jgi:hypothetical protein
MHAYIYVHFTMLRIVTCVCYVRCYSIAMRTSGAAEIRGTQIRTAYSVQRACM